MAGALDSNAVKKTIPPFITEKINTQQESTCIREIKVIGVAAHDGKDAQRMALDLQAIHTYTDESSACSDKEIFINYMAPAPSGGGKNNNMPRLQAASSGAGRGSISIESQ